MLVNIINALLHIHTVEVAGSIPAPPTMNIKGLRDLALPFFIVQLTNSESEAQRNW